MSKVSLRQVVENMCIEHNDHEEAMLAVEEASAAGHVEKREADGLSHWIIGNLINKDKKGGRHDA